MSPTLAPDSPSRQNWRIPGCPRTPDSPSRQNWRIPGCPRTPDSPSRQNWRTPGCPRTPDTPSRQNWRIPSCPRTPDSPSRQNWRIPGCPRTPDSPSRQNWRIPGCPRTKSIQSTPNLEKKWSSRGTRIGRQSSGPELWQQSSGSFRVRSSAVRTGQRYREAYICMYLHTCERYGLFEGHTGCVWPIPRWIIVNVQKCTHRVIGIRTIAWCLLDIQSSVLT